jgi:hypothetical protein
MFCGSCCVRDALLEAPRWRSIPHRLYTVWCWLLNVVKLVKQPVGVKKADELKAKPSPVANLTPTAFSDKVPGDRERCTAKFPKHKGNNFSPCLSIHARRSMSDAIQKPEEGFTSPTAMTRVGCLTLSLSAFLQAIHINFHLTMSGRNTAVISNPHAVAMSTEPPESSSSTMAPTREEWHRWCQVYSDITGIDGPTLFWAGRPFDNRIRYQDTGLLLNGCTLMIQC